jgi:hypothetical protein
MLLLLKLRRERMQLSEDVKIKGVCCKGCGGFVGCTYCSDTNIAKEQRKIMVGALASNKDKILRQAITSVLGDDWCVRDLTGRGEFLILHDKTEIFKFDGIELVHFMVPETKIDNSISGMKVNVEQQYRFLNAAAQ